MSTARFYIPPERWNPQTPQLDDQETRHATEVLRLVEGDPVVVFNGKGSELGARLGPVGKQGTPLIPGPMAKSPPMATRIALAQAIPKGKNMDLVVQKATELGVGAIHPILSERTVIKLSSEDAARKQEKWQRTGIEACKQSGQNWLPRIASPMTMEAFLSTAASEYELLLIASLQPGARHLKAILAETREMNNGNDPASVIICIGPEGDFTPAEISRALAAGAQPMGLGPIVLRTETAAIYSLSVLAHELLNTH